MGLAPACYPCFLRQAVIALELGGVDEARTHRIFKALLRDIKAADPDKTPSHASSIIHRRIRKLIGADPFRGVKSRYNRIALGLYDQLKETVANSPDPLNTAIRLAIAGNIIDFGIFTSFDIKGTIEKALTEPLAVDDYEPFLRDLSATDDVLYLLDNAGEAVFDRILIEELTARRKRVVAVVKGSAVLNDCTMEDAIQTGIADICKVMDNGSDAVGTVLEATTGLFRERFGRLSNMVISKGQGNFETLLDCGRPVYFLFQSKCEVVSRYMGQPERAMFLLKGR